MLGYKTVKSCIVLALWMALLHIIKKISSIICFYENMLLTQFAASCWTFDSQIFSTLPNSFDPSFQQSPHLFILGLCLSGASSSVTLSLRLSLIFSVVIFSFTSLPLLTYCVHGCSSLNISTRATAHCYSYSLCCIRQPNLTCS